MQISFFPSSALTLCLLAAIPAAWAGAPKQVSGEEIAHTPRSPCLPKAEAETQAKALADAAAVHYCRSHGHGWRSARVKTYGEQECGQCDNGHLQCGFDKIEVDCLQRGASER